MLLLGALLAVASVVLDQMRCVDAARAGARAAARHDPEDVVTSTARTAGPPGSRVTVSAEGDQIVVTVRAEVRLFLPGRPRLGVGAQAVADAEATARQPPDRHPVRPPGGPEGA